MTKVLYDFGKLATSIHQVHSKMQAQAGRAVDVSRTMRNWLIGCYIAEYQMRGADRAKYGEHLLKDLAIELKSKGMRVVDKRDLERYRKFYTIYPQIWDSVSPEFIDILSENMNIDVQLIAASVTPQLEDKPKDELIIGSQLIAGSLTPQLQLPANELVNKLS